VYINTATSKVLGGKEVLSVAADDAAQRFLTVTVDVLLRVEFCTVMSASVFEVD
jgi:hypothetical protein